MACPWPVSGITVGVNAVWSSHSSRAAGTPAGGDPFSPPCSASFLLSFPSVKKSAVYVAVVANFVLWTPLGCLLTAIALWRGWRE